MDYRFQMSRNLIALFIGCFFAVVNSTASYGQLKSSGRSFFLTMGYCNNNVLHITSKYQAHIQFYYSNSGVSKSYVVPANHLLVIPMTDTMQDDISYTQHEVVQHRSLEITSDSVIAVTVVNWDQEEDDGMTIYPTDQLLPVTRYYLISLRNQIDPNLIFGPFPAHFTIVATCDSVLLQITPKVKTVNHFPNIPFTVLLNKGDTYALANQFFPPLYSADDLSGTEIEILNAHANMPVHIYSMQFAANGFNPLFFTGYADRMFEEIQPVEWWKNSYPIPILMDGKKLRVKVVSASASNQIYFDNTPAALLNAGQVLDTLIDSSVVIHAGDVIGIAIFSLSEFTDTIYGNGDPDMLWPIAPDDGVMEGYFRNNHPSLHYDSGRLMDHVSLTIVSDSSNIDSVFVDGVNVGSQFHPFPHDPAWQYAFIPIDSTDTISVHSMVSAKRVYAFFMKVYVCGGSSYALGEAGGAEVKTDTFYKCAGASIPLSVPGPGPFRWSNGATGPAITIADTGLIEAYQGFLCDGLPIVARYYLIDTQLVSEDAQIYDTVVKCQGSSYVLSANASFSYFWSTGDTVRQITVDTPAVYYVDEMDPPVGCIRNYVRHYYNVRDYEIGFSLGPDTTACMGDQVRLLSPYQKVRWSTGDTGKAIYVRDSGMYTAVYVDSCSTQHWDSIYVSFDFCPERFCNISFPSAFTPNGDEVNDVFRPIKYGAFTSYYLAIYDRWGELLWSSYDMNAGWDGMYKGTPAELGTYMYMCQVNCPKRGHLLLKGDVTLIK